MSDYVDETFLSLIIRCLLVQEVAWSLPDNKPMPQPWKGLSLRVIVNSPVVYFWSIARAGKWRPQISIWYIIFLGLYFWADGAASTVVTVYARASAHARLTVIYLISYGEDILVKYGVYVCMICSCLYVCGFYIVSILLQDFTDILNMA